jgi:nucleoside-diphosphate-sugar epimerase
VGATVVVVGATGNVGSSLVEGLADEAGVDEVRAVARRPAAAEGKVRPVAADIASDDLAPAFEGADTVVHLAWAIQPSHDAAALWRTNVLGSWRVFDAAVRSSVQAIVSASSIGAYSPGPKDRLVGEEWPTDGIATSFYSRHKVVVERLLDGIERANPETRIVRLRPALTFKRASAAEQRRLFLGPLLPGRLLRPGLVPAVPDVPGLRTQAVHTDDVAAAYRLAVLSDVRGAFNVAADPPVDAGVLARMLDSRTVRVPAGAVRTIADLTWRLHLQPTPPGWLDMGLQTPLLSSERARRELGWTPRRSSVDAIAELLEGLIAGAGAPTPTLSAGAGGPARVRELATGVGGRDDAPSE